MIEMKRGSLPAGLAKTNRKFKMAIAGMSKEEAYAFYDNNKGKYKYNTYETTERFKKMTYERCSFCTQCIQNFDTEMTVEHIRTKRDYPKKIFQWSNLLCSCNTCNGIRGTSPLDSDKYLDPTKVENISQYFEYNNQGEILPNKKMTKEQQEKADYMIKKYKLDRPDLNKKRKKFMEDLMEKEHFYELLESEDFSSQYIIFLSVFTYYRRCVK